MTYKFDCRHFTGYKPCQYKRPCDGCSHYNKVEHRIAVVSLEALGAVLRSTCLLPRIVDKYPGAHVTWITYRASEALLENNPYIDRVIFADGSTAALFFSLGV